LFERMSVRAALEHAHALAEYRASKRMEAALPEQGPRGDESAAAARAEVARTLSGAVRLSLACMHIANNIARRGLVPAGHMPTFPPLAAVCCLTGRLGVEGAAW